MPTATRVPGVLVVHEWWGLDEHMRRRCRMLAELGYTALAVDMYGEGACATHPHEARAPGARGGRRHGDRRRPFRGGLPAPAGRPHDGRHPHRRHRLLLRRPNRAARRAHRHGAGGCGVLPRRSRRPLRGDAGGRAGAEFSSATARRITSSRRAPSMRSRRRWNARGRTTVSSRSKARATDSPTPPRTRASASGGSASATTRTRIAVPGGSSKASSARSLPEDQ